MNKSMKNSVVFITSFGHALCHIAMLAFPVVIAPIRNEFNLSMTELTAAGTAAYMLFGFGAIPAGIAVRFLGGRTMLLIYFGGMGLAAGFFGAIYRFWIIFYRNATAGNIRQHLSCCRFHFNFSPDGKNRAFIWNTRHCRQRRRSPGSPDCRCNVRLVRMAGCVSDTDSAGPDWMYSYNMAGRSCTRRGKS